MKNKYPNKTVVSVRVKWSELYSHTIYDNNGNVYRTHDGYVTSFSPEEHFRAYAILDIDPYTGRILNWRNWKGIKQKSKQRTSK